MATEKQIAANRANALCSTGPKTPEGKDVSRFNAVKHGLLADAALLPEESHEDVKAVREAIHELLKPQGELETMLADRVVSCMWRLRRVLKVEAGLFVKEQYEEIARRARDRASRCVVWEEQDRLAELFPSTFRITDEEAHAEAVEQENHAKQMLANEAAQLGAAFARDAAGPDAFSKLSAYEARIERSLYKALAELQKLQDGRARRDGNVVTPQDSPREIEIAAEEADSDMEPPSQAGEAPVSEAA
jgi:hypothetical protein